MPNRSCEVLGFPGRLDSSALYFSWDIRYSRSDSTFCFQWAAGMKSTLTRFTLKLSKTITGQFFQWHAITTVVRGQGTWRNHFFKRVQIVTQNVNLENQVHFLQCHLKELKIITLCFILSFRIVCDMFHIVENDEEVRMKMMALGLNGTASWIMT